MNWRGRPLISHEVIVQLIASTKTRSGLKVRSEIDTNSYPKGLVVSDADFSTIEISPNGSMANGITQSDQGEVVMLFLNEP